MKRIWIFLLLCALAATPALKAQVTNVEKSEEIINENGKDFFLHKVLSKQTLYSISREYDVKIEEIYKYNPAAEAGIYPDQVLKIPVVNHETEIVNQMNSADFDFVYHIVNAGDTYKSLAKLYSVSLFDVKLANNDIKEPLKKGEYIKIPVVKDEGEQESKQIASEDDKKDYDQENVISLEDGSKILEYTVNPKETVFGICRKFKCTRDQLAAQNPGLTNNLQIGQTIIIPIISSELDNEVEVPVFQDELYQQQQNQKPKRLKEHIVKRKETLYSIARTNGVTIDELKTFNPGLSEDINIGQVIKIPPTKITKPYIVHKVERRKVRLSKLARKYGLSYKQIEQLNPEFGRKVYSGDLVKIPVSPRLVPKETKKETEELKEPQEVTEEDIDSFVINKEIEKNKGGKYKVALLVPFESQNLDTLYRDMNSFPEKVFNSDSFQFIEFYEGFKIAADSLVKMGLNLDLYVYDIGKEVSDAAELFQRPEFKEMNLIVGPFYSRNFKQVSNYAKLFNIPIVNPLTTREEVLETSGVFKVKPGNQYQTEYVSKALNSIFPINKVVLIPGAKSRNDSNYKLLKSNLYYNLPTDISLNNSDLVDRFKKENRNYKDNTVNTEGRTFDLNAMKKDPYGSTQFNNNIVEVPFGKDFMKNFGRAASLMRPNVAVVYSKNNVEVLEILDKLNQLRDSMDVSAFGLPSWSSLSNIDVDYLINMHTAYLSDRYIDYSDNDVRGFVRTFRKEYSTEPGIFAFDGFDIGYYFLGALRNFGANFVKFMDYYHPKLIKSPIDFKETENESFENTHWRILFYQGAQIKVVPEK
ncbi:MAG: LysM peptidoglycan-binding domain-containing protein [Hyphomicrobiales bacterium]